MPLGTSQDLVKGTDFTVLAPQTAAEHNQLVDLATPYEVSSEVGVALILTTTDTAADVPDVPDPTIGGGYNKWKRYIWLRRPFAGETNKSSKIYGWNDDAPSVATYLQWLVVDPSSNPIPSATGSELEQILFQLQTDAAQAIADSAAALAVGTQNTTDIGDVAGAGGGVDLQTQVTAVTNAEAIDNADIDTIRTRISGNPANVTDAGGINGQLITLQNQVTAISGTSHDPTLLTPSATAGSLLRTKIDGTAVEYFDPTAVGTEVVIGGATLGDAGTLTTPIAAGLGTAVPFSVAKTLDAGTWLIEAFMCGGFANNAGTDTAFISIKVGATSYPGLQTTTSSGAGQGFPITLIAKEIVVVTTVAAPSTLGVTLSTVGANFDIGGKYLLVMARKISAKAT